jgi:hypothetical protein
MRIVSFFYRFKQIIDDRFIKLITGTKEEPERISRAVLFGSVVAMTPTFGVQMPLVTMVWMITRPFPRLRFNLPIGLGMTWLTNYFTFLPYYFLIYLTGATMISWIWDIATPMTYADFIALWSPLADAGFWDTVTGLLAILVKIGGIMLFGSLPYLLVTTLLIYRITISLLKRVPAGQKQDGNV